MGGWLRRRLVFPRVPLGPVVQPQRVCIRGLSPPHSPAFPGRCGDVLLGPRRPRPRPDPTRLTTFTPAIIPQLLGGLLTAYSAAGRPPILTGGDRPYILLSLQGGIGNYTSAAGRPPYSLLSCWEASYPYRGGSAGDTRVVGPILRCSLSVHPMWWRHCSAHGRAWLGGRPPARRRRRSSPHLL